MLWINGLGKVQNVDFLSKSTKCVLSYYNAISSLKKICDFDVSMVMHTIVVLAKRLEEQGRMCLPHCHSNNIAFVA